MKNRIIQLLPGIDWAELSKSGTSKVIDLMDWLSRQDDQDCLKSLLRARKNLDGFMAESYSVVLGEAFKKDMSGFIRLLAELPKSDIDEVSLSVAYKNTSSLCRQAPGTCPKNWFRRLFMELPGKLDPGI